MSYTVRGEAASEHQPQFTFLYHLLCVEVSCQHRGRYSSCCAGEGGWIDRHTQDNFSGDKVWRTAQHPRHVSTPFLPRSFPIITPKSSSSGFWTSCSSKKSSLTPPTHLCPFCRLCARRMRADLAEVIWCRCHGICH